MTSGAVGRARAGGREGERTGRRIEAVPRHHVVRGRDEPSDDKTRRPASIVPSNPTRHGNSQPSPSGSPHPTGTDTDGMRRSSSAWPASAPAPSPASTTLCWTGGSSTRPSCGTGPAPAWPPGSSPCSPAGHPTSGASIVSSSPWPGSARRWCRTPSVAGGTTRPNGPRPPHRYAEQAGWELTGEGTRRDLFARWCHPLVGRMTGRLMPESPGSSAGTRGHAAGAGGR